MHFNILVSRLGRAIALGAIGFAIYFGSVFVVSITDASITFADANGTWGGLLAFALAASELFFVNSWSLQERLLRRIILSSGITIASLLIAGQICAIAGIELHFQRIALFWPRIAVAAPLFLLFTFVVLRILQPTSKLNRE